ncbi:hypothetical protein BG452_14060 [Streptomyces sp. CBMA123]|nr:hypothetical protein [Streptomyces sp. CBMA123]
MRPTETGAFRAASDASTDAGHGGAGGTLRQRQRQRPRSALARAGLATEGPYPWAGVEHSEVFPSLLLNDPNTPPKPDPANRRPNGPAPHPAHPAAGRTQELPCDPSPR